MNDLAAIARGENMGSMVGSRAARAGRGNYEEIGANPTKRGFAGERRCRVPGCEEQATGQGRGMCLDHWSENRRAYVREGAQEKRLPLAPLRALIATEVRIYLATADNANASLMKAYHFYQHVLKLSGPQVKNLLTNDTIRFDQADRICTVLGTHPVLVWPVEWVAFKKERGPRKHTTEAKAKMSAARKGMVFTDEHLANLSAASRRRTDRISRVA